MKANYRNMWGFWVLGIAIILLIPWQSVMAQAWEQPVAPQGQDDPPPDDEAFEILRTTMIVFASDRSGNFDIYSMKLDGSEFTQLTDNPAEDADPEVSPDGSKIVFYSTRDGNKEIYLMDIDGGNVIRLTDDPESDDMPSWAPSGKVIVFTSRRNGNADIYLISADGSEMAQYTDWPSDEWHPTWNPEGPEIAFISNISGDPEIYAQDSEGNSRQLTDNDYYDADPDWSPNGRYIVFSSDPTALTPDAELNTDLYVVKPDGSDLQQITDLEGFELEPTWSSDSSNILFTGNLEGNVEVYLLRGDGSVFGVTANSAVDSVPSWAPMTTSSDQ
jgi:Tol biopolymer transport system component